MDPQANTRSRVAGRLAAALRALRGAPAPAPVPAPAQAEEPDPVARAIETLRETPVAEIQRRGFHFQARDFYSALNDIAFLEENRDLWHGRPLPRGVEWDLEAQLEAVRRIAPYAHELADVPQDMPPGPPRYHWRNDFWSGLDALVQYGLLREAKPSRVVEIGCGWSSLLMAEALARNEAEGAAAVVDQIEPYPRKELLSALPSGWSLHEAILQRAPLELFEALGEGDVCFYDGSHVARAGSDVVWFFSEVIPRLSPGVIVHVHDIFWPSDYPDPWIFERGQTWNEQYVLQAFLMYNREFEPLLSVSPLLSTHLAEIEDLLGSLPTAMNGGSFWMRRRSAAAGQAEPPGAGETEARAERVPSGLLLRDAPEVTIKRREPAATGGFLQEFAGRTEASRGPVAEEGINALDWYHTIDLPDGAVTRGMFDHRDLVPHYGIPEDLSGRRVLDVATSSGFWAFEFERRGGEVTATDIPSDRWDWPTKATAPGREASESDGPESEAPLRSQNFELAASALGSQVELRGLSVYDLDPSEVGRFDFVHTADLLVHLERPLEALRRIRSVVAEDGAFLLADAVDPEHLGNVPLTWYTGGWQNVEWWVPSVTTLAQMVHDAGFADVQVLRLYNLPAWDEERGFWRAIIRARP